ncbi:MAG TPA: LapA family protein [Pseudomonadales bacterium]|nr:LapA family protein [Pseudomonadales bacterium]
MRWVYRILSLIVLLAGAGLGVWFYLDNMQPVTVVWFGHAVEGVQLALWLLVFFTAGTLLGLTVSGVQALRHQMHLQILRRQLKAVKQKSAVRAVE